MTADILGISYVTADILSTITVVIADILGTTSLTVKMTDACCVSNWMIEKLVLAVVTG